MISMISGFDVIRTNLHLTVVMRLCKTRKSTGTLSSSKVQTCCEHRSTSCLQQVDGRCSEVSALNRDLCVSAPKLIQ